MDGTSRRHEQARRQVRVGVPDDTGNAVDFPASGEASFINGIEPTVDGRQSRTYAGVN